MRNGVFLRHAGTKLYYSGWHTWSADPDKALDFKQPEEAFERARREMLSELEVVTRAEGSATEKVEPVVGPKGWG